MSDPITFKLLYAKIINICQYQNLYFHVKLVTHYLIFMFFSCHQLIHKSICTSEILNTAHLTQFFDNIISNTKSNGYCVPKKRFKREFSRFPTYKYKLSSDLVRKNQMLKYTFKFFVKIVKILFKVSQLKTL